MSDGRTAAPSAARKWLTAARPWALPASTMPVVFGTSLAVVMGGARLDAFRFLLAFLAMMILHGAANMLSDVFDFRRGLDTDVTPGQRGHRPRLALDPAGCGGRGRALRRRHRHRALAGRMTGPVLLYIGAAGVVVGVILHLPQVPGARRPGGLPEFRDPRRARGVGGPDALFFLAAR